MTQQAGDVSFHRQRVCVGALRAETAESSLPVLFRWAMGGLSSVILVVLGAVNLQFQGQSVSSSLRPILRIMAAYVGGYSLVIM